MPRKLCECVLHRFRQKPPNWTLLMNVTYNATLARRPWLVYTNFYATTLSRIPIHSSKNYSLIFLPIFTLISSIILLTNTPRTNNQSSRSTHQSLHSTLTIQPTLLKYFYIFLFFMQLQNFYHKDGHRTYKRAAGRKRPTTQRRARRPYNTQ